MRNIWMLGVVLAGLSPAAVFAQALVPVEDQAAKIKRLESESNQLSAEQARVAQELKAAKAAAARKAQNDADEAARRIKALSENDKAKPSSDAGDGQGSFAGLKLGVGLSLTIDVGDRDRVSEAQLVGRTVRVTDQDNGRARIMLESHYFFTPCGGFMGISALAENPDRVGGDGRCTSPEQKDARWGIGPFVAIQPGSGEIIDAVGAGVMFGFRRAETSQSFNIGIGIVFDPNTRILGDGFVANQPAPDGEDEIRYRETLQTGILLLTSFSF